MKDAGREKMDIAIIGAGPVGSYTAWRLSSSGYSVKLFEEHPEIGRPEQCAGLVNHNMFALPGLESIREKVGLHDIMGADIFSPSGKVLPLRAGKLKAISMDRALFDKELLRMAVKTGADIELVKASQNWISDYYQADAPRWGEQKESVWQDYADWMVENGILQTSISGKDAFTNEFLP